MDGCAMCMESAEQNNNAVNEIAARNQFTGALISLSFYTDE